ncbi:Nuclear envelope integral membrane protein 1 [Eumeta japonica]|uniref:Nuclear envelope integral membrane protein 1 n=1 Tax=Eumeta variegata TaxID=151549 RepID=A0A4C2AFM4_EUMVA|nr:Nuclear envelope integral membrane protein 1 [Eumeta japonica]
MNFIYAILCHLAFITSSAELVEQSNTDRDNLRSKVRSFWLCKFPPKRRYLTNEEYYEQGVRETTKALSELRKFASSPDCKQWKVMSKLRDPMRFAAFVEGASHLRDEEILHYESSKNSDDLDDSDISLSDESEDEEQFNKMKTYSKPVYNGSIQSNSFGDISEDDDVSEEEDNNYRRRATPSRNNNISQPSTSANASLSKLRTKHSTPTLRARQGSVTRSVTRSQRLYENDFSDE